MLQPKKGPAATNISSKYDFTLQTYAFITSDKKVFATHLQIQTTLQTNTFITSWDEHYRRFSQRSVKEFLSVMIMSTLEEVNKPHPW